MSCWSINSFDFSWEKLHKRFSASAVLPQEFFRQKSNELTDEQDMFCFNRASAFYMNNNTVKNVDK